MTVSRGWMLGVILVAGCASQQNDGPKLDLERVDDLKFHARMLVAEKDGQSLYSEPFAAAPGDPAESAERPAEDADPREPVVGVLCRVVSMPREVAHERLTGQAAGPFAGTVSQLEGRAFLSDVLDSSAAELLVAPSLAVPLGETGTISLINQTSYVQDFELHTSDDAVLADPVIGVVDDGMTLMVTPHSLVDGSVDLEFELTQAALTRPIPECEVTLFAGHAPVTVQTPVVVRQEMGARVTLDESSMLVLGPLRGDGDRVGVAFLALAEVSTSELVEIPRQD